MAARIRYNIVMGSSEKASSITTKKGDRGETGLRDGSRVAKTDVRPEALGAVDELNSLLGLVRASTEHRALRERLVRIQNHLFLAGAEISFPGAGRPGQRIERPALDYLESVERAVEPALGLPGKFVIYGGTRLSALLDVARAVARRAERAVLRIYEGHPPEDVLLPVYLNRLSDVLYLFAREVDGREGAALVHPDYAQNPDPSPGRVEP